MLRELRIENLVLIERAELRFDAGLNVITGETGAGKTVLAHAIDLLLGGKARKGAVRPGAGEAYVEGVFELPAGLLEREEFADLRERLPAVTTGEVSLARRVGADGRTRAFVEGRSATAADLRDLGGALMNFYGQHEHRKLMLGSAQVGMLDGFVGAAQLQLVAQVRASHGRIAALETRLRELEELDGRRERELGLVEFELGEIETLAPDPAETDPLTVERDRLRAVDELRAGVAAVLAGVDGDEGGAGDGGGGEGGAGQGAAAALAAAAARLATTAGADASLAPLAERAEGLSLELADLAAELRVYGESLAADPRRLQTLEERLDAYERLTRKHGGTVEAVLEHAEHCREQRDALAGAAEALGDLREQLDLESAQRGKLCKQIGRARARAAPDLAAAVTAQLADLAFADAGFEVVVAPRAAGAGPDGTDDVEFLIAPNAGLAAAPLRETASGGELSRAMLALLTAVREAAGGTFVFDEVDAGIGGHTANAVGEKLRDLSSRRQVICITHLPQVAAHATRHFQIVKHRSGDATATDVKHLTDDAVVEELCRMLGATGDDTGARKHAEQLLATA